MEDSWLTKKNNIDMAEGRKQEICLEWPKAVSFTHGSTISVASSWDLLVYFVLPFFHCMQFLRKYDIMWLDQ